MTYQWKNSYHKVSADIAGAVCEELEKNENLNAKALVDVSRPEDAPLHSEFEWNDTEAAERWREQQARNIINSLTIVVDENKAPVRKFFNVVTTEANYTSTEVLLQHEDTRKKLLDMALRELNSFKQKYAQLTELAEFFTVIDDTAAKLEKSA